MRPAANYRQESASLTRIDLLLALIEGALAAVRLARDTDGKNDPQYGSALARAQVLVSGLASGVDLTHAELARNLFRLYEFVIHCLRAGDSRLLAAAEQVLETLQSAFATIRGEATELERSGQTPPPPPLHLFEASA